MSDGSVADADYLEFAYPHRWRYDVLRALDYFRTAAKLDGRAPDPRLEEGAEIVRKREQPGGRWLLERPISGRSWLELGAVGQASPWITLKALRVLRWLDG